MSRFLVEAMIQVSAGVPYTKIAFISGNNAVEYHRAGLQEVYHKVLSVKCVPADEALLLEYGDTQGNTNSSDGVPVDPILESEDESSKSTGEDRDTPTDGDS